MIVFSGSSSTKLGGRVAGKLGCAFGNLKSSRFPDGEIYLRILSEVKGCDCVVVQSTPGNDDLVELLLLLDLLRDLGASSIHTVVPYMGYSRQDKRFNPGEALSAKTVLKFLGGLSDSVSTINSHFLEEAGEFDFCGVRVRNLDAFPLVAEYYGRKLRKPMVIAPDKGSIEYAKKAAGIIGCGFDFLSKKRLSSEEVRMEAKKLDVKGRDALILDDMISTGGTVIEAAKVLYKQGARTVNVGCVHGVFSLGLGKVKAGVDSLVCTDTLEKDISKVSVSGLIAESLP